MKRLELKCSRLYKEITRMLCMPENKEHFQLYANNNKLTKNRSIYDFELFFFCYKMIIYSFFKNNL
jgi:hypothetical protein